MKQIFLFLFGFVCLMGSAQSGTEVYSAQLITTSMGYQIGALSNCSNNPGYDNQPSFWSEDTLLYAATRNDQTDVVLHQLSSGEKNWRSATGQGSEYSPLRIPTTEEFSAIRLDTTGLQRLYRYDHNGESQLLHPDLKTGYQLWVDATTLLCTVLVDNRMDLYLLAVEGGTATLMQSSVGRSLHKVRNSEQLSFIHRKDGKAIVTTLDQKTKAQEAMFVLPEGVQDHAWLPDGTLVYGQGSALFTVGFDQAPRLLHQFKEEEVKGISRIAVSPQGKRLALVGEEK